jgi:hypothetical protein
MIDNAVINIEPIVKNQRLPPWCGTVFFWAKKIPKNRHLPPAHTTPPARQTTQNMEIY